MVIHTGLFLNTRENFSWLLARGQLSLLALGDVLCHPQHSLHPAIRPAHAHPPGP